MMVGGRGKSLESVFFFLKSSGSRNLGFIRARQNTADYILRETVWRRREPKNRTAELRMFADDGVICVESRLLEEGELRRWGEAEEEEVEEVEVCPGDL